MILQRRHFLYLAAGTAALPGISRDAWAKEEDPEKAINHFKIWLTEKLRVYDDTRPDRSVGLDDQFHDRRVFRESFTHIEWIANPVAKNGKAALNEDVHLTGYTIYNKDDKPVPGFITIKNQFTNNQWVRWNLGTPKYLLLPASKVLGGGDPPPDPKSDLSDHYVCYEARGEPVVKPVKLEDQFDKNIFKKPEDITKLVPKFFGVPVKKNSEAPWIHKDAHLAIYELTPPREATGELAIKISTNDQFRPWRDLKVIKSLYLAVPSLKRWHQPR